MAQSVQEVLVTRLTNGLPALVAQPFILGAAGCSLTVGSSLAVWLGFFLVAFVWQLGVRRFYNAKQVRRAAA